MMLKNGREYKLQLFLAQTNVFTTADEIAKHLDLSKKTVYRLIKQINNAKPGLKVIESAKGRGYRLNHEEFILQRKTFQSDVAEISPITRQEKVMEELLLASPKWLKLSQLYEDFYVRDSTIANDEKAINKRLSNYNLKLARKNRALQITGEEPEIRKAIVELLQTLDVVDIEDLKSTTNSELNQFDVALVTEQIGKIEKTLGEKVPYPYNVNLFSHLYILISRVKKVAVDTGDQKLTVQERQVMNDEPKIAKIAEKTIQSIGIYLNKQLPEVEQYYLFQYLISSRLPDQTSQVPNFSDEVTKVADFYLSKVGQRLNLAVNSSTIFHELANHVKPMLNRLRNGIRVKNVLLEQIKLSYQGVFKIVTEVSKIVSKKFNLPVISDDENGFITLYFARMNEAHQLPIRTLVMCTTGIGTSELLKTKLKKHFPELEIVDVINTREYQQYLEKYPKVELIITTVGLKEKVPIASLLVSAMLTTEDQARIQKTIEGIRHEN